jgi:hypothetical protein
MDAPALENGVSGNIADTVAVQRNCDDDNYHDDDDDDYVSPGELDVVHSPEGTNGGQS